MALIWAFDILSNRQDWIFLRLGIRTVMHSVDFKDSTNLPKISWKETEKQKLFLIVGLKPNGLRTLLVFSWRWRLIKLLGSRMRPRFTWVTSPLLFCFKGTPVFISGSVFSVSGCKRLCRIARSFCFQDCNCLFRDLKTSGLCLYADLQLFAYRVCRCSWTIFIYNIQLFSV